MKRNNEGSNRRKLTTYGPYNAGDALRRRLTQIQKTNNKIPSDEQDSPAPASNKTTTAAAAQKPRTPPKKKTVSFKITHDSEEEERRKVIAAELAAKKKNVISYVRPRLPPDFDNSAADIQAHFEHHITTMGVHDTIDLEVIKSLQYDQMMPDEDHLQDGKGRIGSQSWLQRG